MSSQFPRSGHRYDVKMKNETRTDIRTNPRPCEQRNERGQYRRPGTRTLFADAPLRHMHMHVSLIEELVVHRRQYPQLVRMALRRAQPALRTLSDRLAKLAGQLQSTFAWHILIKKKEEQ